MPQKGKILKKLKEKEKDCHFPFCALFPSLCHYAHQTPLFWRTIPNLSGISHYPQDTSIIDKVKIEVDKEKSRPLLFLTFPLCLTYCPLCPAKPPVLAHKQAFTRKKATPFFLQFGQERLIWKKPPPPFSSLSLFILSTQFPPCPAKPPLFLPTTGIYKETAAPPLFPQFPLFTLTTAENIMTRNWNAHAPVDNAQHACACWLVERERKKGIWRALALARQYQIGPLHFHPGNNFPLCISYAKANAFIFRLFSFINVIKKSAYKNAYLGSISIPEKYV